MLVFTRKVGQRFRINDDVEIEVLDIKGDSARIGIIAPLTVAVNREEVYQRVQSETRAAFEAALKKEPA